MMERGAANEERRENQGAREERSREREEGREGVTDSSVGPAGALHTLR